MSNTRNKCLKTTLLATSMLTLGSAGIAYAQEATSETVTVTGSRLSTQGFVAPTPVTSVGAADIAARAPAIISDILNEQPQFRMTLGAGQQPTANFSAQNVIDLRGLGVQRTLVLLDGQRFVPTNTNSSVDVDAIPVLLLSRVDTVTGGASAAYGSDAVGGVVNFIMRDRMDGVIGSIGGGISERGDNLNTNASVAWGRDFFGGRLHEVGSLEYNNSRGVSNLYTRMQEYGQYQTCLTTNTAAQRQAAIAAGGLLAAQKYANNCTWYPQAASTMVLGGRNAAGAVLNQNQTPISNITFGVGGAVIPFNVGTFSFALANGAIPSVGALMYGGAPNYTDPHATPRNGLAISEPRKQHKFYNKLTFDIDDNTSVYAQASWAESNNRSVNSGLIQNTGIIIPITGQFANPYVPASLQAAAVAAGLTALIVGRQEEEAGGQVGRSATIVERLGLGAKGKILGDWDWNLFWTHGETHTHSANGGFLLNANLMESIFAVAGPGGFPVCGPVANNPNLTQTTLGAAANTPGSSTTLSSKVTPGCQPFNIFGPTIGSYVPAGYKCYVCTDVPDALRNSPTGSQAAVNYFNVENQGATYYQQNAGSAGVGGSPFSTWAGPVTLAFGVEYREENVRTENGIYGTGSYSNNSGGPGWTGSFSTVEGYFETDIPLLKDQFLAEGLDVDIAYRMTGYSLFGNLPSWKVGVNWQVNDDIRIRANRSRDLREPSLADLFSPTSLAINTSFLNPITQTAGIEYTQSGGNSNLKPETAQSTTVGLVYTPSDGWLSGLNASIDWYSVNISQVIQAEAVLTIGNQCAAGNQSYCALVFPTGGPGNSLLIKAVSANLARLKESGVDLELSYTTPLDSIDLPGTLTTRVLGSFTDYNIIQSSVYTERAGRAQGQAKYMGTVSLTYALGASSTNLQWHYTSDIRADATLTGPGQPNYDALARDLTKTNTVDRNQFPSAYTINLSENYDFYNDGGTKLTAYLNVNNLLDKDPPGHFQSVVAFLAGGNPYDLIGRTFKGGIRFQF